jgi:hypothetical protein
MSVAVNGSFQSPEFKNVFCISAAKQDGRRKGSLRDLLKVIGQANPPDHLDGGVFEEREFVTDEGWQIYIFYDDGDLDYLDYFISPNGAVINVWPDDPSPLQRALQMLARIKRH